MLHAECKKGNMITVSARVSSNVRNMVESSLRPTRPVTTDAINLRSGEPFLDTPAPIVQRMVNALESGRTHYAAAGGTSSLRRRIAESLTARYSAVVGPENVTVTHGGTGALTAAIFSAVGVGDRVVIPTPTYSLFADLVRLVGGTSVSVEPAAGLQLDLDGIASVIEGAAALILCNPCNPTGVIYPPDEVQQLIRLARAHRVVVIVDEAYASLVYEESTFRSVLEVAEIAEDIIYCQTFSKEFAMTGWRVGYTVSGPERTKVIRQVANAVDSSINTAVQDAAEEALALGSEWRETSMVAYARNRDAFLAYFQDISNVQVLTPNAGFFAFVELDGVSGTDLVDRCAQAGVAVRDGAEFGPGGEPFARFSFSVSPDDLNRGLERLESVWK